MRPQPGRRPGAPVPVALRGGGAIALLIAGLSGSSLTKLGLRPLQRITETCRALARGDLSRRSRLPLGKDEIGTLGLAFDEMAERLEASFTAQRIFVADAAHELRTPLATIAGFTDLLLRGARDDPAVANQALRTMLSEEDRMLRLLERMLALARLEAAPPPRREHVDIAALTAALAAETAALAPDLRVRYEGLSAATVEASGDELRQALLNLADNARKYTPQGGWIVFLTQPCGTGIAVTVRNSGPPLPPDALPLLFDRFYRIDASRARATGGVGLGLAITRTLVQRQGGDITVASDAAGTGFTVGLPSGVLSPQLPA